jgi:hypothetical protein
MHVVRTIDQDKHAVYSTVTGEITMEEIRADMVRLAAEPLYSPDMPGIVDMRNATAQLTTDELRQITDALKQSPRVVSRTRRALLVGSDMAEGLYRLFATLAADGRTEYRVFRDEGMARDWVDEAIAKRRLAR